jgi:hypothetical protein
MVSIIQKIPQNARIVEVNCKIRDRQNIHPSISMENIGANISKKILKRDLRKIKVNLFFQRTFHLLI